MDPSPLIETERLRLRLPRPEDAGGYARAFADPETMRYLGDGSIATREQVERGIPRWLERWDEWGVGFFSVERRDDARLLGRVGFIRWDPETWELGGGETELGWTIFREHWGHGYATEAALALRDWGVAERGLSRLISLIRHGNVRSVRVAEKIGEAYERDVALLGQAAMLYSMAL
jgi:ribosomal-protein-alanine N-acetyltransferase